MGKNYQSVVTIEDGVRMGGFGSAVLEWLNDHGYQPHVTRIGLPDEYVEHGSVPELHKKVGLDTDSIVEAIMKYKS